MKKYLKAILCVALCMVMVVTTTTGPVAAGNSEVMQYKYYTVIGDSNSSGYGLDDYMNNLGDAWVKDEKVIEGSYAQLLGEAVGAETVVQCGHCGWRTDEFLRILLDPEQTGIYTPGPDSKFFLNALDTIGTFKTAKARKAEQTRLKENIQKSDLITIDFGANDIFSNAIYMTYRAYQADFDDLQLPGFDTAEAFFKYLAKLLKKSKLADDIWDTFVENLDSCLAAYKKNITLAVREIRALNPTAKIIMIGMFSPVQMDVKTDDATLLDIYSKLDKRVARVNKFLKQQCSVRSEYLYVDVTDTRIFGFKTLDWELLLQGDPDVVMSAIKMLHATKKGHAYEAKQIINALKHETEIPVVTGRYSSYLKRITLEWDKVDGAVKYQVYRASSETGKFRLIGSTKKDIYYNYVTVPGVTYYYEVRAVMNKKASVVTPFSDIIAVKSK